MTLALPKASVRLVLGSQQQLDTQSMREAVLLVYGTSAKSCIPLYALYDSSYMIAVCMFVFYFSVELYALNV
jgi:hypothetical protein